MPFDPLLLPLANAAASCYVDNVQFSWQSETRLCHVMHGTYLGADYFAFAGTMDLVEWAVDLFAIQIPVANHRVLGDVHAGFLLDAQDAVSNFIVPTLTNRKWPPFYVCGHSKGAGEAILAHGLLSALGHKPLATRCFEPPRVGGAALRKFLGSDNIVWTRTQNAAGDDVVTHLPTFPGWDEISSPVLLKVPDSDDIPTKHRIPAVISALTSG